MPRFMASEVPIMEMANSRLLQIFTAPPVPTPPQWVIFNRISSLHRKLFDTLAPMFLRRISAAAKVSSDSAPTLKEVEAGVIYGPTNTKHYISIIRYHERQGSSRCSINSSRHWSIDKLSRNPGKESQSCFFKISEQVNCT